MIRIEHLVHDDWNEEAVENGEGLWRLDLPDVQVQVFATAVDVRQKDAPVFGGEFTVFVEHDVRDASGDLRVKYSCAQKSVVQSLALRLLLSSGEQASQDEFLSQFIAEVKAMPSDEGMCRLTNVGRQAR